jgi:hypothetical protein
LLSVTPVGHARAIPNEQPEGVADVRRFGAKGDGVTDDSAAFVAAMTASQAVFVPTGKYVLRDVKIPDGARLFGYAGRAYSGDFYSTLPGGPILIAAPTAGAILDVAGTRKIYLSGLVLDGVTGRAVPNTTGPNCISAGSTQMYLENVTVLRCRNGVGGAEPPSRDAYTHNLIISNSEFADCGIGISMPIDTIVEGGAVSANYDGISLGEGAVGNNFIGVRVEWNRHDGYTSYKSSDVQIIGGMVDRNFGAGIEIKSSHHWVLSGLDLRRNNRDATSTGADIVLDAATHITLVGSVSRAGRDDDQSGAVTPKYVVYFNGDANQFVTIDDNDLSGFVPGGAAWGGVMPQDLILRQNIGTRDIATSSSAPPEPRAGDSLATSSPPSAVAPGEKAVISLDETGLPAGGDATHVLTVRAHDQLHGQMLQASFPLALWRQAGPTEVKAGDAFGEIGGAKMIRFSDRDGVVRLSLSAATSNGSKLELGVTNGAAAATYSIAVELR